MPSQYQEALDALAFARTIIQPDWENGDGENPPIREWCKTVDALIAGHSLKFTGPAAVPADMSMSLPDAISHAIDRSENTPCGLEHAQLAAWLIELSNFRNAAAHLCDAEDNLRQQRGRLLSALEDAVSVAQAAHQHWAKGEDDKAAKYMMALAGELPGYDGRSDNVHKTGAEFSASEEADHA